MTYDRFTNAYTEIKRIDYEGLPVLISQDGRLVCIQIENDMPSIGIVGIKGSGKSTMMHAILDRAYHLRKNDAFIVMNDHARETLAYTLKCHATIR